jgi:hypothetical protein
MPVAVIPAFWMAVAAGAGAGATVYASNRAANAQTEAAQMQADAANRAGDLQAGAAHDALGFQESEASRNQANFEATQRANYEQWAAQQQRMSSLGQMAGLPARNIPGFVSTNTYMPNGAGPASGAHGGGVTDPSVIARAQSITDATTRGLAPTSQNLDTVLHALNAQGIQATRATHAGNQPSDDKIVLPGGQVVDLVQSVGGSDARWMFNVQAPAGASQDGSIGRTLSPLAAASIGGQPTATPVGAVGGPMAGTLGSYARPSPYMRASAPSSMPGSLGSYAGNAAPMFDPSILDATSLQRPGIYSGVPAAGSLGSYFA